MNSSENFESLPVGPMPAVTFDVRLGRKYDYVDFDYQAFAQQQAEAGVSAESVEDLSINIKPIPFYRMEKGSYVFMKKQIQVGVPFRNEAKHSNLRLAHETNHFQDHALGNITARDQKVLKTNVFLQIGGAAYVIAAAGFTALGITENSQVMLDNGRNLAGLGTAMSATGYIIYRNSRIERRARDASVNAATILTFKRK